MHHRIDLTMVEVRGCSLTRDVKLCCMLQSRPIGHWARALGKGRFQQEKYLTG